MHQFQEQISLILVLLLFAGFWVFLCTKMGRGSGWYRLMDRYPDRVERAALRLQMQSGKLGSVDMANLLRLEACPSGLRLGILRMFGPFQRNIFVPWKEISVQRDRRWFGPVAVLQFGIDESRLVVVDYLANRLARAVPGQWPEPAVLPAQPKAKAAFIALCRWIICLVAIVGFFSIGPSIAAGHYLWPPTDLIVGFGIILGVVFVREFWDRTQN
jgi:hypothetical protein